MALATIKQFLESERTDASVKFFVLEKLSNSTYDICDATSKCEMKIENGENDIQVGEFKRLIRPKKNYNCTRIIANTKSRIVPTKKFNLGNFSPSNGKDSESNENLGKPSTSRSTVTLGQCEKCQKDVGEKWLIKHIEHSRKGCKEFYGTRFEQIKRDKLLERKRDYYQRNQESEREKRKDRYKSNPEPEKKKAKMRFDLNPDPKREYEREKARTVKKNSSENDRRYHEAISHGPIYVCVCCHFGLFRESVKVFDEELQRKIDPTVLEASCVFKEELKLKGNYHVCGSCKQVMVKKKQMPINSVNNGLIVEEIPESLKLTPLENQLICKNIIFMKMKSLMKTRMPAMIDRTVLVPIEDTEVLNNVEALPRTLEEGAVVPVKLKRMKGLKNSHAEAFVRPGVLFRALATLKSIGNPHYQDVLTKCMYCAVVFKEGDDIFAHDRECFEKSNEKSLIEESQNTEESNKNEVKNFEDIEEDDDNGDDGSGLKNVKAYQAVNDESCVINNHPEVNIIVNDTDVPKKVNIKDSLTGDDIILAPGEGQIPSKIMKTENYDTKGFPILHPSAKYGIHFERKKKMSKQQYVKARLLHHSGLYANNSDYLFMSQQYVERGALEGQFSIATQQRERI